MRSKKEEAKVRLLPLILIKVENKGVSFNEGSYEKAIKRSHISQSSFGRNISLSDFPCQTHNRKIRRVGKGSGIC